MHLFQHVLPFFGTGSGATEMVVVPGAIFLENLLGRGLGLGGLFSLASGVERSQIEQGN
jgi:hypothetical protein